MKSLEIEMAEKLLDIKAVKLQPSSPFIWASGWKSPIYCDNRKTLSYPDLRRYIRNEFVDIVRQYFPDVEVIAGVATGAIAQGVLVAEELNLPFVYVRNKPKDHGLENLIEGNLQPGQKVLVLEDLISTGGSSLKAVEAVRNAGCEVTGMLAMFTYGFSAAAQNFEKENVKLIALSNYEAVLKVALDNGYIKENELAALEEWRKDPANWKK